MALPNNIYLSFKYLLLILAIISQVFCSSSHEIIGKYDRLMKGSMSTTAAATATAATVMESHLLQGMINRRKNSMIKGVNGRGLSSTSSPSKPASMKGNKKNMKMMMMKNKMKSSKKGNKKDKKTPGPKKVSNKKKMDMKKKKSTKSNKKESDDDKKKKKDKKKKDHKPPFKDANDYYKWKTSHNRQRGRDRNYYNHNNSNNESPTTAPQSATTTTTATVKEMNPPSPTPPDPESSPIKTSPTDAPSDPEMERTIANVPIPSFAIKYCMDVDPTTLTFDKDDYKHVVNITEAFIRQRISSYYRDVMEVDFAGFKVKKSFSSKANPHEIIFDTFAKFYTMSALLRNIPSDVPSLASIKKIIMQDEFSAQEYIEYLRYNLSNKNPFITLNGIEIAGVTPKCVDVTVDETPKIEDEEVTTPTTGASSEIIQDDFEGITLDTDDQLNYDGDNSKTLVLSLVLSSVAVLLLAATVYAFFMFRQQNETTELSSSSSEGNDDLHSRSTHSNISREVSYNSDQENEVCRRGIIPRQKEHVNIRSV